MSVFLFPSCCRYYSSANISFLSCRYLDIIYSYILLLYWLNWLCCSLLLVCAKGHLTHFTDQPVQTQNTPPSHSSVPQTQAWQKWFLLHSRAERVDTHTYHVVGRDSRWGCDWWLGQSLGWYSDRICCLLNQQSVVQTTTKRDTRHIFGKPLRDEGWRNVAALKFKDSPMDERTDYPCDQKKYSFNQVLKLYIVCLQLQYIVYIQRSKIIIYFGFWWGHSLIHESFLS